MNISTFAATGPQTQGNGQQFTGRAGLAASDFETFLKMLTTQMQNQDPLNPMNATDFAQQLATFSGVEQQVRTNALLESLVARSGIGELAGWVGMEARAPSPAALRGAPLDLALNPAHGAERSVLVVRDAMGNQVDSQPIDPAATTHRWHGLGADGMPLPDGLYSFEMVGFEGGVPTSTYAPEVFTRITEIRQSASGPSVVLEGGRVVEPGSISALRR